MRRFPFSSPVSILLLAAFAFSGLGCVSTRLPPISQAGSGFQPLEDERELWEEARGEEEKLLQNVQLYRDPLLESYLEGIVDNLNPRGMAANREVRYQVRVIQDPTLNAFAYPHGSVYVHTGILARMENEDQLATVLGHEMTHVENRHMVRQQRTARNRAIGLTIAAVGALVLLEIAEIDAIDDGHWMRAAHIEFFGEVIVDLGLQLAFVASVNGYGRQLETEADEGGFAKLEAAGYDLREAPVVYQKLFEERGDSRRAEAFFFGSHPRLSERIADSKKHLAQRPASPIAAADRDRTIFEKRIRPVVREDARLNLEAGRLALAEEELARVRSWNPDDPELPWLEARLWLRQSAEEPDAARKRELRGKAAEALHAVIRRDVDRPAPHRELGFLLYEDGDRRGACRELGHYLELDPAGDDEGKVEEVVDELRREGQCS